MRQCDTYDGFVCVNSVWHSGVIMVHLWIECAMIRKYGVDGYLTTNQMGFYER